MANPLSVFVWDHQVARCFANYYGQSMAVVIAENEKHAWEVLKQQQPEVYLLLLNIPQHEDWTKPSSPLYPSFIADQQAYRQIVAFGRDHNGEVDPELNHKWEQTKKAHARAVADFYSKEADPETGRTATAYRPKVFELGPVAFYSQAYD